MNAFTSTTLTYSLVQDRRRSFEDAAARRRLVRSSDRAAHAATAAPVRRPPDPEPALVPLLTLVNADMISGPQHLPAAPVSEPTTVRVA
jgi:hypothetical protein